MKLFSDELGQLKKAGQPLYKMPKSIQETIELLAVSEDGIFEAAKDQFTEEFMYQDINYTTANDEEQLEIFERYVKFLNSIGCRFKITLNNKNRDMKKLREQILIPYKDDGYDHLRQIYNDIMEKKIVEGRQGIEQERYLTLTIDRKNYEEAKAQFATLEVALRKGFNALGADIMKMNGNQRLKCLHDYYHLGSEEDFDFDIAEAKKLGKDFKNDLCNGMVKFYPDYFEDEKKCCRAMFIKRYSNNLSDRFLTEIAALPVHSMVSIDVVPVPKDLTTKVLQKKYLGIESDILKQQRVRNRNNDFSSEISYGKRREKSEIEGILNDVNENDQCLFYVGVTILLMAENKKELDSITETVQSIGKSHGCLIDVHYFKQREALNTALPIGVRQV